MSKLLIVDDEPNVLYSLQRGLQASVDEILTARTAEEGLERVRSEQPDAVVLDIRLPDMSGLDAFDKMRAMDRRLPVIVITAHGTTDTAIEAMKRGAFEYLLKPLDLAGLRDVIRKALETSRLSRVPAVIDQTYTAEESVDRIVGDSPQMQEVYKQIGRVAPQDVTVLLLGESGTGKELVARAIYQHSSRFQGPFLAINCAAIPESLLESELFGHERGAFTGAERRRIGKFEQVDGGTVFLDEIGDMTPATQSKVLRLLQDGRFERVGGNETLQTDVRVIAATNRDLESLVTSGEFRQDLYYRLNVFTIHLPPLRERLQDLTALVEHFAARFGREMGKEIRGVRADTISLMESYDWPGNVRELQSAVKYALVHATGGVITPDCLPDSVTGKERGTSLPESPPADGLSDLRRYIRRLVESEGTDIHEQVHLAVDRILFEVVLEHTQGNQVRASELLGISRTTFRSRLQTLGMTVEKTVRSDSGHADQSADSN